MIQINAYSLLCNCNPSIDEFYKLQCNQTYKHTWPSKEQIMRPLDFSFNTILTLDSKFNCNQPVVIRFKYECNTAT